MGALRHEAMGKRKGWRGSAGKPSWGASAGVFLYHGGGGLGCCVFFGGVGWPGAGWRGAPPAGGPPVGTPAETFSLPDLAGRQRRLAEFAGRPVLLNFWAFWCDTWKEELPHLKQLAARQEEMGFRLITISVDGTRVPRFKALAGSGLPFPILLDPGRKVSDRYRIARVPTVVLIDAAGRVRWVASGYPGNHRVLSEVRKLAAPVR